MSTGNPINTYFNAYFVNESNEAIPARYQTTLSTAVLDNPEDYLMAIERFDVSTTSIPLTIWSPDDYYSITLLQPASGATSTQGVNYIPRLLPFTGGERLVYSFNTIADMVKTAIDAAWAVIQPSLTGAGAPTEAPRFSYDEKSGVFRFLVQPEYLDNNADRVEIYMNQELFTFFTAWYAELDNSLPAARRYRMIVYDNLFNETYFTSTTTQRYLELPQQWDARPALYVSTGLVIVTSALPIITEDSGGESGSVTSTKRAILTDFTQFNATPAEAVSRAIYFAAGSHRWVEMQGSSPLNTFDFQIFWRDRFNELRPVMLDLNQGMSIKFIFRRKDFIT